MESKVYHGDGRTEVPDTRGPRRRFLVLCVLAGILPPRELTGYVVAEMSVDEGGDE